MKRSLFIISLLLSSILYTQNENKFSVTYKMESLVKLESLPDSIKNNGFSMEVHYKLRNQYKNTSFKLKIADSVSEYGVSDWLTTFLDGDNWLLMATKDDRHYVDDSVYLQQYTLLGQEYLIETPSYKQEWTLVPESKTVLGYTCHKAVRTMNDLSGSSVVAWYAPKLSVKYGPNGHHGLPGLILEVVERDKMKIYAEKIDFEDEFYVYKPSTGFKISQEGFNKKLKILIEEFPKKN